MTSSTREQEPTSPWSTGAGAGVHPEPTRDTASSTDSTSTDGATAATVNGEGHSSQGAAGGDEELPTLFASSRTREQHPTGYGPPPSED